MPGSFTTSCEINENFSPTHRFCWDLFIIMPGYSHGRKLYQKTIPCLLLMRLQSFKAGYGVVHELTKNVRSEEHTSELQSRGHLVCRLLLEKKKQRKRNNK